MLIISRKLNESFFIQDNIEVTLLDVQGDKVKIGINAPSDVKIMRAELLETVKINREAAEAVNKNEVADIKSLFKKIK